MKTRTIQPNQPLPKDWYDTEPSPEEAAAIDREYVQSRMRQAARSSTKGIVGELGSIGEPELREYKGELRTLDLKFDEHSDGVFTFKSDQSIAFIDKDKRVTVRSMHPDALKAALELAHERIGDQLKLEGSAEFRSEMKMLDAKSLDQEVVGELRQAGAWEPKKHEGEPRTIDLKFDRQNDGSYTYKEGKKEVAFIDKGEKVTLKSKNEDAIKASLELAQEKFGEKIRAYGSETGRQKAWLVGSEMGLTVTGYEPTEQDKKMLEDRLQAAKGDFLSKGDVKQKDVSEGQAQENSGADLVQKPAQEHQDKVTTEQAPAIDGIQKESAKGLEFNAENFNNLVKDAKIISIETRTHDIGDFNLDADNPMEWVEWLKTETEIKFELDGKEFSLVSEENGATDYDANFGAYLDEKLPVNSDMRHETFFQENMFKEEIAESVKQHKAEAVSVDSAAFEEAGAELMQKLAQEHTAKVDAGTLGQDDSAAKTPESGQELSEEAGAELMQKLAQEHTAKVDAGTLGQDDQSEAAEAQVVTNAKEQEEAMIR